MTRDQEDRLMDMLTYCRPAGSQYEREFINKFIKPLGDIKRDKGMNLYRRIGKSRIAWSCHTDTVHGKTGRQPVYLGSNGIIALSKTATSRCLGADDAAGVFLMTEMIRKNVPGLYLFHFGEECGGKGSSHIATKTPELLEGIDCAIALDRKATHSVITHQFGGRCASDVFAESLAAAIGLDYRPDSTGLFTDTANYTNIVPECTNLSVGYYSEHTKDEVLDVDFLSALLDKLLVLDPSKLVLSRQTSDVETEWDDLYGDGGGYGSDSWSYQSFKKHAAKTMGKIIGFPKPEREPSDRGDEPLMDERWSHDTAVTPDELDKMVEHNAMTRLIEKEPDAVAAMLQEYGISYDDLMLYSRGNRGY